jgi:hypothetical protein
VTPTATSTSTPTATLTPTITPTTTFTPTATVTPTATPTVPAAQITLKLMVNQTPIAGAPIRIDESVGNTDNNGEVVANLSLAESHLVESGLPAISFTPIYETGAELLARSPVTIEAERLISSGESPCRVSIGGTPSIYFSTVNASSEALSVPLAYNQLNSIYSVTSEATPPQDFAPGDGGFALPERFFTNPDSTLMGVWNFLGQQVTIDASPAICTDRGVPGECQAIDPTILKAPFMHTKTVIARLARQSILAAKRGTWRGSNGSYKIPFLARGARALTRIESAVNIKSGNAFICSSPPPTCQLRTVRTAAARAAFRYIFRGTPPRGLEPVYKRLRREAKAFEKVLRSVPPQYVVCP